MRQILLKEYIMFKPKISVKLATVVASAITVVLLTACSFERKVDYELAGMVMDANTKQPLEGVYVVAVYMGGGSSMARSAAWCEKTLGMTTQADGKFHFPARDEKGRWAEYPVVFKSGYDYSAYQIVNEAMVTSDRKLFYTDQNVLLALRDPESLWPRIPTGASYCTRAAIRADAAPAAELLAKIAYEYEKYRLPKSNIENIRSMISRLESLPEVEGPASGNSSSAK
jgi:hypothetical protein